MATERVERRLAAILAADVAGYSRLMAADEEGTHERLKAHLRELVDPKIKEHRGRIVKNTGDGLLAEFPSAVNAVRCAAEIQCAMKDLNAGIDESKQIRFRIGVHLGDVIVEPDDIFGDDVNIASRLEALAEPGGVCISHAVRDRIGARLPYSFKDIGEQSVKNIAHRVHVYRIRLESEAKARSTGTLETVQKLPLCMPDKASIAVLPFQNISGDPEQDYFADGMVEEIITALSRIRWLFVIARNSSFTYKGRPVDIKQVGRELGVCYVLEGSIRKTQNRVRISAQLIDALSGAHLWADRFEGSLEDVFQLQDDVALSVAGFIEPALQAAEMACAAARPTTDLTAYDLYLRAYATHLSAGPRSGGALDLLEQAIERDPHYGPALALAAVCRGRLYLHSRSEDPEEDRRIAAAYARRALQVAGDDPRVLADVAYALAFLGEDIGATMALVDRALALNPSFARGWYISGGLRLFAGHLETAIDHAENSLRLSPRERVGWAHYIIAAAHFFSRRFEEAVQKLLVTMQQDPSDTSSYRILAACYAHMGRIEEAREVIARLRAITPDVMPNVSLLQNLDHRELYLSGVRMAAGDAT